MRPISSFLRNFKREEKYPNSRDQELGNDATQHTRKDSKLDFFRKLRKGSSSRSENQQNAPFVSIASSSKSSATRPDLTSDPNKPLPPPPPDIVPQGSASNVVRPTVNLQRIMAPIALPDLHRLFSGAPQFCDRSEGHYTGAPHPSVAFPWDSDLEIRDLSDHQQIHDAAWNFVTAWPHITLDVQRDLDARNEHHERVRAHFLPRCRERPNMLSAQGLERGTMGFAAALEIGVSDADAEPVPWLEPMVLAETRLSFLNTKVGLRVLAESKLMERLIGAGIVYLEQSSKHEKPTVELYTELFTQLLFPPSRVTDSDDPYSLQVQIEALIDVLAADDVWFDFSQVEWRFRLGEVLWGSDRQVEDADIESSTKEDRYWLLLQILLSSELLLRLDTLTMKVEKGLEEVRTEDIIRFDKTATQKTRWSLVLARRWLENIQIDRVQTDDEVEKKSAGWLSSLTGTSSEDKSRENAEVEVRDFSFQGRHQKQQLNGLIHFAKVLRWPDVERLAAKLASGGIIKSDGMNIEPSNETPSSFSTRPGSYFSSQRSDSRMATSRSQPLAALLQPRGWLSRSYIDALILPGEMLPHLLIATLLENDELAVTKLGREANLYGGFVYSKRSFWSTASIVGRVLAAGRGAHECMGWVSSEVVPKGIQETWVNIDVEPVPTDKTIKPRIWSKAAIERDSSVIGGTDASSVLLGDFVLLPEEPTPQNITFTKFDSLDLFKEVDAAQNIPTPLSEASELPRIQTFSAVARFSISVESQVKEITLELKHDVLFVTSFPCVVSSYTSIIKSPSTASFTTAIATSSQGTSKTLSGHPLHKAFTYTRLPLSTLLTMKASLPFEALVSPSQSPTGSSTHTTNSAIPRVLVIDCTDDKLLPSSRSSTGAHPGGNRHDLGNDTEMLARALCADRGWNALVSRRSRGCLACSIREAGALGWRVILRLS